MDRPLLFFGRGLDLLRTPEFTRADNGAGNLTHLAFLCRHILCRVECST